MPEAPGRDVRKKRGRLRGPSRCRGDYHSVAGIQKLGARRFQARWWHASGTGLLARAAARSLRRAGGLSGVGLWRGARRGGIGRRRIKWGFNEEGLEIPRGREATREARRVL